MAKVVLTIEDIEETGRANSFTFTMESDPGFPDEAQEVTVAQALGLRLAELLVESCEGPRRCSIRVGGDLVQP